MNYNTFIQVQIHYISGIRSSGQNEDDTSSMFSCLWTKIKTFARFLCRFPRVPGSVSRSFYTDLYAKKSIQIEHKCKYLKS